MLSTGTLTDPTIVSRLTDTLRRTMVIDADWNILDFARRLHDLTAGDVDFVTAPAKVLPDGTTTADPAGLHSFMGGLAGSTRTTSATAAAPQPTAAPVVPVAFAQPEPTCVN